MVCGNLEQHAREGGGGGGTREQVIRFRDNPGNLHLPVPHLKRHVVLYNVPGVRLKLCKTKQARLRMVALEQKCFIAAATCPTV